MAQLARLSLAATLCLLGSAGLAQVSPSGDAKSGVKLHGNATSTKIAVLQCTGKNAKPFTVKPKPNNPDTVIFATPPSCPLNSFEFDDVNSSPTFVFVGNDSDGNYVYSYKGDPIPSPGYSFTYTTTTRGIRTGNGTGVIK